MCHFDARQNTTFSNSMLFSILTSTHKDYEHEEFLFKLIYRETIMKNYNLILAIFISTITATAYAVSSDQQDTEAKSVAWYTANVKEARQKNKLCYDNTELQATQDCKNALHALELVYVGVGN